MPRPLCALMPAVGTAGPSSEDHPFGLLVLLAHPANRAPEVPGSLCLLVQPGAGGWQFGRLEAPGQPCFRWDRACAIVHATGAHRIRLGLGSTPPGNCYLLGHLFLPVPGLPSSGSGSSSWAKEELDRREGRSVSVCFWVTPAQDTIFSKMEVISWCEKVFQMIEFGLQLCLQNWSNISMDSCPVHFPNFVSKPKNWRQQSLPCDYNLVNIPILCL